MTAVPRTQQDAEEYLRYLLDLLTAAESAAGGRLAPGPPTALAFAFDTEDRVQCTETGRLSYPRTHGNLVLGLDIPLAAAVNKDALEGFQACACACATLQTLDMPAVGRYRPCMAALVPVPPGGSIQHSLGPCRRC